jgi:hypothetical protein
MQVYHEHIRKHKKHIAFIILLIIILISLALKVSGYF